MTKEATPQPDFRPGFAGNQLPRSELDVRYSEIGGPACLPAEAPDLLCHVCYKPLRLLVEYVSANSDPDVHRVIFVFMCDSRHYQDSLRVYAHQCPLQTPITEDAQELVPKQEAMNPDQLLDLLSKMDTKLPEVEINNTNPEPALPFELDKSEYKAFDAFTRDAPDLLEELALNPQNYADSLHQICHNVIYLSGPTHLCEERCIEKLKKGHFLQKSWQEVPSEEEQEEGSEEPELAKATEADMSICQCGWCNTFLAENAHEIDIFGAIIWKLQLKVAEFKVIYCYAPVYSGAGWQQGMSVVLRDDDDVSALVAATQKGNSRVEE